MKLSFYDISAKKPVTLTVSGKRTRWKGAQKRYLVYGVTKAGRNLFRFVTKEVYDKL